MAEKTHYAIKKSQSKYLLLSRITIEIIVVQRLHQSQDWYPL